jgi:hypothetical protein
LIGRRPTRAKLIAGKDGGDGAEVSPAKSWVSDEPERGMADVFLSYSKGRRGLTEALAQDLEAEGFSVWWDMSLLPVDNFRDEIDRQLDQVRRRSKTYLSGQDLSFVLAPGDLVLLPKLGPHTWRAYGPQGIRFTVTFTPSGFERFFKDIEQRRLLATDVAELRAVAADDGMDILGPSLSDEKVRLIIAEAEVS